MSCWRDFLLSWDLGFLSLPLSFFGTSFHLALSCLSLCCLQPFHLSLYCLFYAVFSPVLVSLLPCVIILTFCYFLRPASPRNRPPSVSCLQSSPGSSMQNVECIPRQRASCPPSCSDTTVRELTEEEAGLMLGVVQAEFASTARGQRCFC